MSNIEVVIQKNDLQKIARMSRERADAALRVVANEIVTEAKLSMTQSSASGREYRRGRRTHIASAPGSPPRVDTGALRASIRFRKIAALYYEVVDGVKYGIYLELGTRTIAARPFMIPAAVTVSRRIPQIFDGFLNV